MTVYRKLPEIGILSIADQENVEKLEKILNSMNDYEKSFLSDEDLEKAQKYIDKMKDIVKVDGDEGADEGEDGEGEEEEDKTDEV